MKFRSYQLFYLIALAALIASLAVGSLFNIYESDGALSTFENFRLVQQSTGEVSYVVCALGVVLIFDILLNIFGLFISFFQNFELQKRVAIHEKGFLYLNSLCPEDLRNTMLQPGLPQPHQRDHKSHTTLPAFHHQ